MKKSGILLAALAAVALIDGPAAACGPLGRLRARLGACRGQGQQQFVQPQPYGDPAPQPQPFDNSTPNDDTVRFMRVGSGYPWNYPVSMAGAAAGVNCPCGPNCPCAMPGFVNPVPVAAVAAPVPTAMPAITPLEAAKPGAAVADDVISPPGVGIAAVERRTAVLEAKVAALEARLAAVAPATTGRSTVYLSGSAPYPAQPASAAPYPAIQLGQPLPMMAPRVYYAAPGAGRTVCGPNGCYQVR